METLLSRACHIHNDWNDFAARV